MRGKAARQSRFCRRDSKFGHLPSSPSTAINVSSIKQPILAVRVGENRRAPAHIELWPIAKGYHL
jgi:hypothetical protein